MAISEEQLTIWAKIGAQSTSKETYATVKLALEDRDYGRTCTPFLQGSYGNDTNIRVESDVDIVMELGSSFYYDLSPLPTDQKTVFHAAFPASNYNFKSFREDVLLALTARFGDDVTPGSKAITINARDNRRKADVLVAFQHRKYLRFPVVSEADYVTGITFFKDNGTQVVNYPRLHSEGLTSKNQSTAEWFKHLVRIFKNARQSLIAKGALRPGVAPSYYIEGLLYNVPDSSFGKSYEQSMFACLTQLVQADRSSFKCPNRQYPLLDGNADVTWNSADCQTFINAVVGLWNG